MRNAWAEINSAAISRNVEQVRQVVTPAMVWVVVKADGYGHGAIQTARAALRSGADGLCVALVQEGIELRRAGLTAPILVLSEQPLDEIASLVEYDLIATVYSERAINALRNVVREVAAPAHRVHLKVDTGMHRVGVAPEGALALARKIAQANELRFDGVFTHLACADEPSSPSNTEQLERFDDVLDQLSAAGLRPPLVHAANSAGALAFPRARYDMVRLGIAAYGITPGPGVAQLTTQLQPAMALKARVSFVRRARAGEGLSYGLQHRFERDTNVATVPIGYADGVPRRLFHQGGSVLIGGDRRPIVGVVTMDQLMVDCGDDPVQIGDEVVLIGAQTAGSSTQSISADEWAQRLGTIAYEIVCGISKRIQRLSL